MKTNKLYLKTISNIEIYITNNNNNFTLVNVSTKETIMIICKDLQGCDLKDYLNSDLDDVRNVLSYLEENKKYIQDIQNSYNDLINKIKTL